MLSSSGDFSVAKPDETAVKDTKFPVLGNKMIISNLGMFLILTTILLNY